MKHQLIPNVATFWYVIDAIKNMYMSVQWINSEGTKRYNSKMLKWSRSVHSIL